MYSTITMMDSMYGKGSQYSDDPHILHDSELWEWEVINQTDSSPQTLISRYSDTEVMLSAIYVFINSYRSQSQAWNYTIWHWSRSQNGYFNLLPPSISIILAHRWWWQDCCTNPGFILPPAVCHSVAASICQSMNMLNTQWGITLHQL